MLIIYFLLCNIYYLRNNFTWQKIFFFISVFYKWLLNIIIFVPILFLYWTKSKIFLIILKMIIWRSFLYTYKYTIFNVFLSIKIYIHTKISKSMARGLDKKKTRSSAHQTRETIVETSIKWDLFKQGVNFWDREIFANYWILIFFIYKRFYIRTETLRNFDLRDHVFLNV